MSGEIPVGWAAPQLEKLFDYVIGGDWGKAPDHGDDNFTDAYCIRGTEFRNWEKEKGLTRVHRKIKTTSLENRKLQSGDILVEISGGGPEQPVGRTVLIDSKALEIKSDHPSVCTNFIRLARPNSNLDSRYLNYYLKCFYQSGEVTKYQGGSNNLRNLKFKEYCTINVPLAPLNEQIRIANKLDSLLAKVDAAQARLDKIPALLKRFRQSVLAAATSGELTKGWRKDNDVNLESENIPFAELLTELRNGLSPKPNSDGIGYPILRISSVRSGEIDQKDIRYLDCDDSAREKYRLNSGDLLFTRYNGSLEFVGVCGLLRKLEHDVLLYPDKLIRARICDKALPEYIEIFFSSPSARESMINCVKTTSGQKGISGKNIKSQFVSIPSLKEQKEIVRRVESLFALADTVEKQYNEAKKRTDRLIQSLLAKAFRGELVPQDPNDEPASELLKRIQAEREVQKPAKKTRRKTVVS